jgi:DNA-binding transcriptional ArsR family regulator
LERVFGSPGRIRILLELARNPRSLSVYRLRMRTGLRSEDIKKHLRILVDSGMVEELQVGHQRMYMLHHESPLVQALIDLFKVSSSI